MYTGYPTFKSVITELGLFVRSALNLNSRAVGCPIPPVTAIPVIEPSNPCIVVTVSISSLIGLGS